ncbi:3-keto-5-aminohexanoate cleavage protein [Inquilinus sp. CAU 1745]|uniref:3-keto-5-aminohexanoate cleavage protein n=1 Tax=Inquilinus sp. CAU 1745 TaxID=3140369 RepID=UPI00325A9D09
MAEADARPAGRTIMVAPNGARRTKEDHPALPMTVAEVARTAAECREAGADAIHVHVRDRDGAHVLDAELYGQATAAIRREAGPDLLVQITTEAVGRYRPEEQAAIVRAVRPRAVSIALKELCPEDEGPSLTLARDLYHWAAKEEIAVQHILYAPDEIERAARLMTAGVLPSSRADLLFVLGRYVANQESDPGALTGFLSTLAATGLDASWSVCAFGRGETAALAAAMALGGHARVGFENSLRHADGSIAANNRERVAAIAEIRERLGLTAP